MDFDHLNTAGKAPASLEATVEGTSQNKLELVGLETVRYDTQTGLVPVVVQDALDGTVLMLAYANREALKRTLGTQTAWFWSRSRSEYWQKGATSGNTQRVVEVRVDCDGDCVLYLVQPAGPACHTGQRTCFFRTMAHTADELLRSDAHFITGAAAGVTVNVDVDNHVARRVDAAEHLGGPSDTKNPIATAYDSTTLIARLWGVLDGRFRERPKGSYTSYLFEHGVDKIAKKVAEEAAEVVIAAKNAVPTIHGRSAEGQTELAKESADLLFHLLALWRLAGIGPDEVFKVLEEREN